MVYTKTCSGEHLFSLDSRHGPNPEWNVDLAFTYGAFASQSVMHVTVNQMFYSASDLTDSLTSSVGSGHMLWEEKAVKWKATLSMNQVLLCGHGEEGSCNKCGSLDERDPEFELSPSAATAGGL